MRLGIMNGTMILFSSQNRQLYKRVDPGEEIEKEINQEEMESMGKRPMKESRKEARRNCEERKEWRRER